LSIIFCDIEILDLCCVDVVLETRHFLSLLHGRLKAWQRLNEKMNESRMEASQNFMKAMKKEHQER